MTAYVACVCTRSPAAAPGWRCRSWRAPAWAVW